MIPKKVSSYENGTYNGACIEVPAHGTAYELLDEGSSKEIWRIEGRYASQVYLSSNGKYLVRMGYWATDKEPSKEDLAVAFYHNGKLLSEYSTADLIKRKRGLCDL